MAELPTLHIERPERWLLLLLLIVIAVIVLGTLAYMIFEDLSLFDAAYQTIIVVSTLGIRDSTKGDAGKVVTFFLVIMGIGTVTYALSALASMVVEGKLRTVLGRRKVTAKIANLKDHYIICGYGRMGQHVSHRLAMKGRTVVVIENDENATARAEADGYLYVLGNAHEEGILESAGVVHAKGLVTVLPSDGDNVFVTLTARELNPSMVVVSRAESLESIPKLKRAGATSVISPHAIGARRMAASLLNPAFIDFVEAAAEDEDLEVGEIRVPEGSSIVGQVLSETGIRSKGEALIISVIRAKEKRVFNPPADFVLQAGDCLLYVGTKGTAQRLRSLLSVAAISQEVPSLLY